MTDPIKLLSHNQLDELVDVDPIRLRDEAFKMRAEIERLRAKLDAPCGSCHPCVNYADETWRAAGLKPPHVYQWDELQAQHADSVKTLTTISLAVARWRQGDLDSFRALEAIEAAVTAPDDDAEAAQAEQERQP